MATGAVVARILTQYSDKGSKQAQKDIRKLGKDIDAFGKKASKAFKIASVATVALAGKIGKDAVQAAIEDSKSQAILASNLRNVTGATDATIASVEDYISKQQMLANVSDTELRASFSQLVTASGDVTSAITLQGVALDTAAGTGADLSATSAALAKASQGNFTALKKLVPALDNNIVKNKDLNGAIAFLNKTYKGSAKILGDTDPLKKLSLAYGEVLETLGYALLPTVIKFTDYLIQDLLPRIQDWISLNKDKLAKSLETAAGFAKDLLEDAVKISLWATNNIGFIKAMGVAIGAMFVVGKVTAFIGAINGLIAVYKTLAASAGIAAVATAFATGGVSLAAGAVAIGGYAFLVQYLRDGNIEAKKLEEAQQKIADGADKASDAYGSLIVKNNKAGDAFGSITVKNNKALEVQNTIIDKNTKDAAKRAAIEAKTAELRNRIEKKYGLKLTDQDTYENIQLTAVEMLQKKQKVADLALLERIKARKEEVLLFEALNGNAEKYTDLLKVLSDQKITSEEIAVLAKKWGMTTDAVTSYIFTIFAIKDTVVSADEVKVLADSWGITVKQAEQYLDFFSALNDGKLSDAEITKLMDKWMLTRTEASKYADFVSKIGDGKLNDSEITKLKSTWGLTTQQVVDYIKQIGGRVDATGTILSAGDIAALGWTNALTALQKYLNELAKTGTISKAVQTTPSVGYGQSLAQLEAQAAQAYRVMPPVIDPSTGELTARGRRNIPDFMPMANGGIVTSPTQALIGEAGAEAVIPLNRIGSILSSLTNSDGIGSSRSNTTNITVNVAGSVTSQNDLVAAIRNGLLRGQSNGQTLTLQAI
jgi:hypothetical protein